ncbi:MAG TPA: PIN domain-containing protein, partial [Candidatus Limnocylindrales bacterium]
MSRLTDRLPAGDRILLDSSVLAAYFDGGERTSALAAELVDEHVRSGRNPAVVSMVSVMETLIRPLRRLPAAHATVLSFFRDMPNLSTAPVDLDVAAEAATLRVAFGLAAPDALIAATGFAAGAAHLVTNDRAWRARLEPLHDR